MAAIIVVALVAAWLFIGNYIPKLIRYIISGILDVVAIVFAYHAYHKKSLLNSKNMFLFSYTYYTRIFGHFQYASIYLQ